jgi:acetolactate synthase-1/2/3 large subunit
VTGLGLVCPLGNSVPAALAKASRGERAIRVYESPWAPPALARRVGGTVEDFDSDGLLEPRFAAKQEPATLFALAAAREALAQAGHVDTDASVFGAAYPHVRTEPVLAEVGSYVRALLDRLGPADEVSIAEVTPLRAPRLQPRTTGPVRPQFLLEEIQRGIIDASDAWLMAESGNSFCWSTHLLRFREPGRYRVSTGFGSMGHATTGVVGAALARRGKAVALVGDGAMMMMNELHSAVQYRADAIWIVLNDASYLMCAQGMRVMGWEPFHCDLPRVDFVALARAIGAGGERVATEGDVAGAIDRAMRANGPWVLDVTIDPREAPPSGRRNKSLMEQGHATGARA